MSPGYLNVCRLCAGSCKNSIPIFEKTGLLDFAEKIKSYLHIEIKNSDDADGPRICNACYEKIIKWDQYAEQVRKVQGMFLCMSESSKCEETLISKERDMQEKSRKSSNCDNTINKVEKKARKDSEVEDSEFSEEDEVPLSDHGYMNNFKGSVNRAKGMECKKIKPKIKLKIKRVKKDVETTKNDCETDTKEVEDIKDCLDENETDSKDKNKITTSGVQPLFTWECLECHAPVKNWNALVKHCKTTHKSNASVQCVCGKFLQSRASIMKHRMKHTIGYGYKCEFEKCNKTFHRQQLLDVHLLSHMPKELQPWMCCKCSRRFHTESLLKQHEKVHLPREEKLIHPCEVCQKKFCSKSAVTAHVRAVHFGERPFVCDQCGHSFTSKGILHEHLTIHSDVYNFHCKDCNKSFKTKYRLKIHMDTHVETRYQCPICTLTLNTRRTLRMHLLVHRDDKAFQCTTCGKGFKRSKDLKNHYNLHTGRRPYICPFCQRTFANGSNCRSHKRRMHPEELKMYEAALAAGQQPTVMPAEGEDGTSGHVMDDSNESKASGMFQTPQDKQIIFCRENTAKSVKEENDDEGEELAESTQLNESENEATNLTQIAFESQSVSEQYPVHSFYTFQSSGIPAFPGNPFCQN